MKRFMGLVVCVMFSLLLASTARADGVDITRRALDKTLPEVKLTGVSLVDAIDFLRDVSGANIHVNWKAVEAAGIGQDTLVNVRLRAVSLRKVLNLILSEASGGAGLTFYYQEGVIEITTTELADAQMFTRVYPVEDLLMEIPNFEGPNLSLASNTSSGGSSGGRSGGGGGGLISRSDSDKTQSKAERAQSLVQLIIDTVQPEIWRDNGGTAAIRYYNGNLVVTAPRSVHEAIGGPID